MSITPELKLMQYLILLVSFQIHATELDLSSATIPQLNAAMDAGVLSSEILVTHYLARIDAYDQQGPSLNAVITLNPKALQQAREMDAERADTGRRSLLHGIPIVLKDNIDTHDMPTTAGSFMLKNSIPPDDAFVVKKLREAGAIVLAKVNLSEFASGESNSSLGGPIYNPHDLKRSPGGSSGGTGVAIAAAFASIGLGTDTGGSVRMPSSNNGIVGLKTTHGLIGRDGVIPMALSFDVVGPMTRSVTDIAIALNVLAGSDKSDAATQKSVGRAESDYTKFLDIEALKGARIGIAREFMKNDAEVDWVVESALQSMRDAGAEVVDIEFPGWLMSARGEFYRGIRFPEFKSQIADYLGTLEPQYPKNLQQLIESAMKISATRSDGARPNPTRWALMLEEVKSNDLNHYEYLAIRDNALPLVRQTIEGLMLASKLDAIVYPTTGETAELVDSTEEQTIIPGTGGSPVVLANLSGFPELVVPIGFTGRGLPVTISMLGTAFSEPTLIGLGYALEQRLQAIRLPVLTPPLKDESLSY